MEKQFRKHPRFAYEASRDGTIRNSRTKIITGSGRDSQGYCRTHIGKIKYIYSHKLIYECFHGLIDPDRRIVHDNGHRSDNRLKNLSAITISELRKNSAKKSVSMMHRGYKYTFKSAKDAASILGVNESSMYRSARGERSKVYLKTLDEEISLKYSEK